MKTLALDIGKTMAVCTNIEGYAPTHRLYDGDRRARAGEVMLMMHRLLRELKPKGLEVVVYEDTFARGINATKALYGLVGIIEATCANAGFTAMGVPPQTVKTFATGKGNATKEEMIAAAQIMGYDGDNEHEADSYCLLKYAEATIIEVPDELEVQGPDPGSDEYGSVEATGAGG